MTRKAYTIVSVILVLICFTFSTAAYSPQFADEAGTVRLRWKNGIIPIAISGSLLKPNLNIRPDSDVAGAIRRSLETWEKVAQIKFIESSTDKLSVSPAGKSGDGLSLITIAQTPENLVLFGNDPDEISARTRVFYNSRGYITEADIVLNPYQQFSTDGSIGTFDLQSTLTHEIGHLLGLEHSSIIGATMQAGQGKNGIYNLPGFVSRTLADDDIAGIRSIYGAGTDADDCCGSVGGALFLPDEKPANGFDVWAEESDNGRVIAGVQTDSEGKFQIEGLPAGDYRIFARDTLRTNPSRSISAQEIGEGQVSKGKKTVISGNLQNYSKDFEIRYVGFNGQLSELAVPVNAGKSYIIYVGGRNLDADDIQIGFNSPYVKITPKSIIKLDYGKDISVISCEIELSPKTPLGEYSFFVKKRDSAADFSIGSISVERQINPWNSYFTKINE